VLSTVRRLQRARGVRGRGVVVRRGDERGVVAVWSAMMLVLLLGMAAFAIDVSYWHLEKTREQHAADAASLAGAVTYPDDPASSNAAALGIAGSNGYSVGGLSAFGANGSCPLGVGQTTRICAGPGAQPYQYKVKVVRQVNNFFGGIFGIGKTTVSATATAEYLKPLSMGSPSNQFGNDPDSTSWPISNPPPQTYPNFWGNIAGGNSVKQNGDAYAADYCDIPTDGCSAIGGGANVDYNPKGYFYSVDFTSGGTVNLQAFDPAFVDVGDFCTSNATNSLLAASNLTTVPSYPQGTGNTADIKKRYRPVTTQTDQTDPGYQYCTGDNLFTTPGFSAGPPPTTTYTVLKGTIPGDPNSGQPVCSVTYPGFSGNLASILGSGGTVANAPGPLATYFRQWVTLCPVTGQAGDEYFIEVSTDRQSAGHNRFSLRATTNGGTPASEVNIAGNAYMGIYANVGGGQTSQFYLARVPSAAAGHTLVLNFYDIGDASSTGSLQVVPPPDSNVGNTFTGCRWTGNSGTGALGYAANTPASPWGPLSPITQCLITGVNGGGTWNAQWSTVQVPIPGNYTCQDADPQGCWLKINYLFAGGVNDTTSWSAYLLGDPVRLTQ
jgi:Putative Flp pilus-assembly TadE/G-like